MNLFVTLISSKKSGPIPLATPTNLVVVDDADSLNLTWEDNNETLRRNLKVIGIGGATMEGESGPTSVATSYMGLLEDYLSDKTVNLVFDNLAVASQNIYHLMPTGSTPPGGRPSPNTSGNITFAISQNPTHIIIHDGFESVVANYTTIEIMNCYSVIKAACDVASIPLIIITSQPMTTLTLEKRTQLKQISDLLVGLYGSNVINIFDPLAIS